MNAHALGALPRFLIQAAIVIAVSRALGLGARRIRQPLVIAEIVAGIVLGPSLLGWLSPGAMATIFPVESMPLLSVMSQAGLVLFMFLVGLELDPRLLSSRVHTSVAISHSSIVVPFALGATLAFYLYPRLAPPNVSLTSFTLFMGMAMSITAFPVLARILLEQRLLRTRPGAVAIACAAVDDVTAWCILAFVVSIVRSSGLSGAGRTVALALTLAGVMLFVVRPYLARLADRSRIGLNQNLVAFIVVLVFLSSLVTEFIGVHALFGAFLFGAILPKQGSIAAAIAEKLEDVVVVVLLPLFFAYSGLRTQVGLLQSPGDWLICGAITLIACAGKFGGSAVAARLTGIPWREASAIGILMNTRGLMELVALNVGHDLGVISPKLFTMMVIMALATTFMTTPLIQLVYPMAALAREISAQDPPSQSGPVSASRVNAVKTILCVPLGGSGRGLVTLAAALAQETLPEPRLYMLELVTSALRSSFVVGQHREDDASAAAMNDGESLVAQAVARGARLRLLSFVSADPTSDVCAVADVKRADLVVLGSRKRMIGDAVLTGTASAVMAAARSDVAVLVDRGLDDIRSVLVLYDDTEHARAALGLARRIVRGGAHLTVVNVMPPDAVLDEASVEKKIRAELTSRPPADLPVDLVVRTIRHSSPIEAAVKAAADQDLVMVGVGRTFGLEPSAYRLKAEPMLARITCSALVVRAARAETGTSQIEDDVEQPVRFSTLPPTAS
jgi:K+:H+ antiporter